MPDTTDADARREAVPPAGSLPFFARFLEGQHGEERSAATTKYPSEDSALRAVAENRSLKYPSDRDEDIEPFHNS